MLKELHRFFVARNYGTKQWVHRTTALQIVEYPRGTFKVFRRQEGDLALYKGRHPEFDDVRLCDCCGPSGFLFRSVYYNEGKDQFHASSVDLVKDVLRYVEIWES
jgi:hypothetical protein